MKLKTRATKVVVCQNYRFESDNEMIAVSIDAHTKYNRDGQFTEIYATSYETGQDIYQTVHGEMTKNEATALAEKLIKQLTIRSLESVA